MPRRRRSDSFQRGCHIYFRRLQRRGQPECDSRCECQRQGEDGAIRESSETCRFRLRFPRVSRLSISRMPGIAARKAQRSSASERSRLSVSSCLTIRHRPAPRLSRTAISRRLAEARASSRLAMLRTRS